MITYSPRSWLGVVLRIHGTVIPRLAGRLVLAGIIGILAALLFQRSGFRLPTTVHTLIGVALGLLLVFRTNTSYDRYWEGRKLLSVMVARTRDVARQIHGLTGGNTDEDRELRRDVRRMLVVWYGTVRQALRHETDLSLLRPELTKREQDELHVSTSRPSLVLQWLTGRLMRAVKEDRLPSYCLRTMDVNLQLLGEAYASAERILNTPVPFAYAHHIKSFLTVFCFTVPFALVDTLKWATPVAAVLVAYAMFGIEEIGVEIEDPFGHDANDLPLDELGKVIEADLASLGQARESTMDDEGPVHIVPPRAA